MRASVACLLAVPFVMTLSAQMQPTTLAALHDNARPLLIFAGTDDAPVQQQLAALANHAAGLRERDMRVILLGASYAQSLDDSLPVATLTSSEQAHARQQFHVAPGRFTVLLAGKDGGEKLRSSKPMPWQKLASTIDAMPMRRNEMKQR